MTALIYGWFVASKVGKSGLNDVTVDVYSVNRTTSAIVAVQTGAATFAVGGGLYGYAIADPTLLTLEYLGIFKTADVTVDAQHVAALRIEYEDAKLTTALVVDGAVYQLTANALELAPAAPTAAANADAVWDEATSGHVASGSFGLWASGLVVAITAALTAGTAYLAAIAAAVWAYATRTLTQSAASVTAAVSGSALSITAYATYTATLTGLTIPADWLIVWLTAKLSDDDTDANSVFQLKASNPAAVLVDGLAYLNQAAGTLSGGSLTVSQAAGTIAVALTSTTTAALTPQVLTYDVKCSSTVAGITQLTAPAACNISLAVTRAVA